jgi:O-acetyl-ADP-ribose deacetylase (regulator of RNase III)
MIEYTRGNLLEASAEALVNTVNEVGVMGKGIALMFRDAFPENTRIYEEAAKANEVRVGRMLVTDTKSLVGPRWIINFPTKRHWRYPSKLDWIREGLKDLVSVIREHGIRSIALPPLGCGNGGLDWRQVRMEIETALAGLSDVHVIVYEPIGAYQNAPKQKGAEKLTPARALVADLVRQYGVLGLDCTILEVHKLAYFLQRKIKELGVPDPLKLRFKADRFGPYADQLRHLLDNLDGSYLHCEKRLSDAGAFALIEFEDANREKIASFLNSSAASIYLPALEQTATLIDGFQSPLGMELLATVDWLLIQSGCEPNTESLRSGLQSWPGASAAAERKQRLFDDRLLGLALDRLTSTHAPSSR